jgi:Carboxypeptidase regulatory-like domain
MRPAGIALGSLWLSSALLIAQQQQPPVFRDISRLLLWSTGSQVDIRRTNGTLDGPAISGTVVDGTTDAPIPAAAVTLSSGRWSVTELTDSKGRFVFLSLRADETYHLDAACPGYFDARIGIGPGVGGRTAATIKLAGNEWFANARLRLWRPAAISGRIVDESGQPLPGATVRAFSVLLVRGQPVLARGPAATTDDLGDYRLSGMTKGTYVVAASIAGPSDSGAVGSRLYFETFYSSSSTVHDATRLSLEYGDERARADIVLRSAPSRSIRGTVRFINGQTRTLVIRCIRAGDETLRIADRTVESVRTVGGRFEFPSVSPGRYVLEASVPSEVSLVTLPGPAVAPRSATSPALPSAVDWVRIEDDEVGVEWSFPSVSALNGPTFQGSITVAVDREDIDDAVIEVQESPSISGRLIFDDEVRRLLEQSLPVFITTEPFGHAGRVDLATGKFTIAGLPSRPQYLRAVAPGFVTEEISWNGTDYSHRAFDLGLTGTVSDVRLRISLRGARIVGTVRTASGLVSSDSSVFFFQCGATEVSWGDAWGQVSVSNSGSYRIQSSGQSLLPAGAYCLVPLRAGAVEVWRDPEIMGKLMKSATRVEVNWGDEVTQDLRLADRVADQKRRAAMKVK